MHAVKWACQRCGCMVQRHASGLCARCRASSAWGVRVRSIVEPRVPVLELLWQEPDDPPPDAA